VEKTIYGYILRYSKRQQIVLTLMAVASFPFLYAFYELPKRIVNQAIEGKNIAYPTKILDFELEQIPYLLTLCGFFLVLVLVNQSFKYMINVYRGLTAERMLRRLRYDLFSRVLRFPQPTFRKISQGEIIQMTNAEVEPLGGFFGDAFSVPVFQGGTLLVILGFLVWQNVWLASATVMFYPMQFYLIPKLQRKVNLLAKERVRLVRGLSENIGETVGGMQEVHASNAARFELAGYSTRLGDIFETRYKIYLWKFVIKFINNTVNHLGPFFFFSAGGYFVIQGTLEIGTLVAILAANKDLAAPWKELLNYYQRREDARIKYGQVVEQFEPAGMMEASVQLDEPDSPTLLSGALSASAVRMEDETGHKPVDGMSFEISPGDHVAIIGAGGSGKDQLGLLLARLLAATGGTLRAGDALMKNLPEAITGRQIGYVGASAFLFSTSVRDNLLYGLRHRPLLAASYSPEEAVSREKWEAEASRAGNSVDDPAADWVDYDAAGVEGGDGLTARMLDVLGVVDLQTDIYALGLRGSIDSATRPALAGRILQARFAFGERLSDPELAPLVEVFDRERYNDNATVGENLLFGQPVGGTFDLERLAESSYVLVVLELAGLTEDMLEAGRQVATTMVELFADLPPGHEFFERYAFISHEDLPGYQALLARLAREGTDALRDDERTRLLSLPFRLSPARHRLDVVDDAFKVKILAARKIFADNLPSNLAGAVEYFSEDSYTAAASIQDNILFGKLAYGHARGAERIAAVMAEVVDDLGLRNEITEAGLEFHVGIGGGRLSSIQRQKLGLARAILKRPKILVLNEATAILDGATQGVVMSKILKEFEGRTVVWILHRADLARQFDQVLVMQGGRIAERGAYSDLDKENSLMRELINVD
jgi:ABC-type multidrug transport system fused ATPase/permease subunit